MPWNWGPAGQQYGAQAGIDANLAANQAAQAANAAAVQQASYAAAAPTGTNNVYNSPVAFGDYSYGTVGGYPSFGEASGGGGGGGGGDPNATPYDGFGQTWGIDGETGIQWGTRPGEGGDYSSARDFMGGGDYGTPSPPQQQQPFETRWEDTTGQLPLPPVARPGSGPDGGWGRYFDDVTRPQQPQSTNPDPWQRIIENSRNQGGIGSDALRDQFAWTLAQSSPYNTPSRPPSQPTANQGYNPGMENWFANPGMQQWPSQVPQGPQIDDLQKLLEEINRTQGYDQSGSVGNSSAGG